MMINKMMPPMPRYMVFSLCQPLKLKNALGWSRLQDIERRVAVICSR